MFYKMDRFSFLCLLVFLCSKSFAQRVDCRILDSSFSPVSPNRVASITEIILVGTEKLTAPIKKVPESLKNYVSVKELSISVSSDSDIDQIMSVVSKLPNIEVLSITGSNLIMLHERDDESSKSGIRHLPESINDMHKLVKLDLSGNYLRDLPLKKGAHPNLEEVHLYNNSFVTFPKSLLALEKLNYLNIGYNYLSEVPDEIVNLKKLESFDLDTSDFTKFPQAVLSCPSIKKIGMMSNAIGKEECIKYKEICEKRGINLLCASTE